jgi:uncharacterized protein involved in exopolysaccharide biosynthesis
MNSAPTPPPDEGEEIRRWLGVLAHGWAILLAGAVLGALLALLATWRTPPLYEAVATLDLLPPTKSSTLFTTASLRSVLTDPAVAAGVVRELKLDAPPHSFSAAQFIARAVTVEEVPTTLVMRLKVRLRDPQQAALAARRMAEGVVEFMARLWRTSLEGRIADLEPQVQRARDALADAQRVWAEAGTGRGRERSAAPRGGDTAARQFETLRLENDLDVRGEVYVDLAKELETARIEHASGPHPLRIIDFPAVPAAPVPGTRNRTLALGLLAGLIVGACLLAAREWRGSAP